MAHILLDLEFGEYCVTKTVLVVGPDLGFVFWLGQTLDSADYQALPAKSVADAAAILSHWGGPLDVLVISSKLPEARLFVSNLRSVNAGLRVIAIAEQGSQFLPGADATCARGRGKEARIQWLETIDSVLHQVSKPLSSAVGSSEPNQEPVSAIYPQKSHRSLH
jgi:hypothetical protein